MAYSIFGSKWNNPRQNLKAKRNSRRANIGTETLECREQLSLTVTEFPLPPVPDPALPYRGVGSIVTGSDGNLWYLQYYSDGTIQGKSSISVGRMTPQGEFTEFPLPIPADWNDWNRTTNLTAGADGNLWISASDGDETSPSSTIFRLTTSGELTDFELPEGYKVGALAVTGRGTVWFAFQPAGSFETGGIGRMTPGGRFRFSNFKTTNNGAFDISNVPNKLTIGPNGGVWFAGSRFDNESAFMSEFHFLGRTSESGSKLRFLDNDMTTSTMTTGPDRSIWSDAQWYSKRYYDFNYGVAKFDTHGKFHLFETLTSGFGVSGGPDGNLWTLGLDWEGYDGPEYLPVINRVTTNGIVTVYSIGIQLIDDIPDFEFPSTYITSGPANSLWISDSTDDGRIVQIGNLDTFSGALDSRFESEWFDESEIRYVSKFENYTHYPHPRFAGTAPPGSVVTVYASPWVEGQNEADPDSPTIRLGAAHANRRTGVWQMKSGPALANGKYLIYAGLGREPQSTGLMYPLSQNILSPDYELYGVSPLSVIRKTPAGNPAKLNFKGMRIPRSFGVHAPA